MKYNIKFENTNKCETVKSDNYNTNKDFVTFYNWSPSGMEIYVASFRTHIITAIIADNDIVEQSRKKLTRILGTKKWYQFWR